MYNDLIVLYGTPDEWIQDKNKPNEYVNKKHSDVRSYNKDGKDAFFTNSFVFIDVNEKEEIIESFRIFDLMYFPISFPCVPTPIKIIKNTESHKRFMKLFNFDPFIYVEVDDNNPFGIRISPERKKEILQKEG